MSQDVGALITSAPGAGKTLVATEVAKGLGARTILIVAPQGTHRGAWLRTIVRQGLAKAEDVHVLIGTPKGKKAFASLQWSLPGIYITTPQWFARQNWKKFKPDMVIFDEIHLAGAYGINTQKQLHNLSNVKWRMGLSGTPLRNKFENAWSICRWVQPGSVVEEFWVWRLTKCATKPHPFAPQGREVTGEKVPGELFNSLGCYIQHLQRERCCDFHPDGFLAHLAAPLEIDIVVPMSTKQRKFYREMENALASTLLSEDGDVTHVHAEEMIVVRNMLRRAACGLPYAEEVEVLSKKSGEMETRVRLKFADDAESYKIDALVADLPSHEGKHTLVLTHSKQIARLAVARIAAAGYTVEGWHGDVSKTQRDKVLDRFRSGELEVIVGVISAMGTGTDGLQEVCYNVDWLSMDDDASNNVQGIGRLDRLGQDQRVVTRRYLSDESIDIGFYSKQLARVMALAESLRKD
jgi:superfamily II DNA or RNA helicase